MTEVLLPKFRSLGGAARAVERTVLIAVTAAGAFWALGLQHHLPVALFNEQYLGLFLGLGLAGVFIVVKAYPAAPHDRVPWYDWVGAAAGLGVGLYIAILYPSISYTLSSLTWDRLVPATVAIALVLEATRRIAGWALMWIAVACILYAKFGWLLPGLLYAKGSSWGRIAVYLYLDSSGILGLPLAVTASIVVAYIFFGQALTAVRGDAFLTDIAMASMGRYRGGSAKMAVVSSSLYGTVSGSAVANVVVDGAVTIPMMKRSGYPPHLAAAIEAVSSNGGQIMPPVMGAAAFLIAEYLSIPYGQVALAAALPAVLYYLALFVQIDLEAAKLGLAGLPRAELPRLSQVMRGGWVFLVPLGVLLYTLMIGSWEAGKAGMLAVGVTLLVGCLQRATRPGWRGIADAVEGTGRTMLDLIAITTLAGIVIGSFQLSGLTSKLPIVLTSAAGGNVFLLLVLTAAVSILLGMSLPTTVVYVTLAVLIGPALAQLGIPPLAAHLFLFYFGMLSLITPPDCLATYAAAAIAKADFWKTGWMGMRLGVVAYVVPFVFVFHPALIGRGTVAEILMTMLTASVGVVLLGIGCAGYLFRPLSWWQRAWAWTASALLLMPPLAWLPPGVADAAGLAVGLALILGERRARTDVMGGSGRPPNLPAARHAPGDPGRDSILREISGAPGVTDGPSARHAPGDPGRSSV
jgi:TRAP transporter 4TM/12TM fusion protein